MDINIQKGASVKVYAITHGEAYSGYNPSLTAIGSGQVTRVGVDLLPKIPKPPLVIAGTGLRFMQTCQIIKERLRGVPVK